MEAAPWFLHKKHFFVFTSAGKPVWTRHGDETDLSTFIGSLTAILYKFQNYYKGVTDHLRYLRTQDMVVAFLCTEALYYVCISKLKEPIESIYAQLENLHKKVICTLTGNITTMLINRPSYDARTLMGGTHAALSTIVKTTAFSPAFLNAFLPVRLHASYRQNIHNAFRSHVNDDVLFGFVMTPTNIIYRYIKKGAELQARDVLLVTNLLTAYTSLRSTKSWTPICLPDYSDKGFLYAYITFIEDSNVGLTLISDNAGAFNSLKNCGNGIESELMNILPAIEEALDKMPYSVSSTEIKELRHFVYCPKSINQYTMPGFDPATKKFLNEMPSKQFRRLLSRYYNAYRWSYVPASSKSNFLRIDVYRNGQVVCMKQNEFTLLASFSPLLNTSSVMNAMNSLIRWLKQEEGNLFIVK